MGEDAASGRMKSLFLTQSANKAGIYAMKLYIRGLPTVVVVDDYLPFYGSNLIFDRMPSDSSMWSVLLEKAFAKINGNYEYINYGWQTESYHILTGAPAKMVTMSSISKSTTTAYNDISAALAKNFLVGCDTSGSTIDSLPTSHAYSVLGAYQLKDTTGKVVHTLFRVRNPWGYDVFTGAWADKGSAWTTAFKAQVPYSDNTGDGIFFIEDTDFVNAFYYYQIAYVHDDYAHSYYSKTSDDGSLASYSFKTTKT